MPEIRRYDSDSHVPEQRRHNEDGHVPEIKRHTSDGHVWSVDEPLTEHNYSNKVIVVEEHHEGNSFYKS